MNLQTQDRNDAITRSTRREPDVDNFTCRVREAAESVVGHSRLGREIAALCDRHAADRNLIIADRSHGLPIVASVGPAGQGKTTLVSWLVSETLENSKKTDQPEAQATPTTTVTQDHGANPKIFWFGPNPPAYFDPKEEVYRHCQHTDMQSIGLPYLMLDSPGLNDEVESVRELAAKSLALSTVVLLVVRADQLRSEVVTFLTELSEGTLVVPVINAIRQREESLEEDVASLISRLREVAPSSRITTPVLVDDFEIKDRSAKTIGQDAAAEVGNRIEQALGGKWEDEKRRVMRLGALDSRFRKTLQTLLSNQLPGMTSAVQRLRSESIQLPSQIAESLVGGGGPLQAAIRARLRLALLTDTAAYWFPYRSLLGLMNLTHGAWDRLLISFSGSLPSLLSAIWTSAKDRQTDGYALDQVRTGVERRGERAVREKIGPLAQQFRDELNELRVRAGMAELEIQNREITSPAELTGLETLQTESQQIFDREVELATSNRFSSIILGFLGTGIFWALMSAPIVSLYSEYLQASYDVFLSLFGMKGETARVNLDGFPAPPAGMLLTSVLLSILPTGIFAMIVLSLAQSKQRVEKVEQSIRSRHHDVIHSLQMSGVLQLRWDDPLLKDAEFLLTVGASESDSI